ncbi:protein TOPAZ1 isoform X2 [Gouania willdenowi]|uniref:protein TOPAZ1 isoform X2 n=1 Tax=Gouania willdenowi TaxID=441366 RepID=UPI0010559232|nr:protein TOPAZ1 isoform X2 [Gouania willdenowi]
MLPSSSRVKLNRAALKDTGPYVRKAPKSLTDINPEESLPSGLFAGKNHPGPVRRGRPTKKRLSSMTRGRGDYGSVGPQRETNKARTRCVKQRADVAVNPNRFAESSGCSQQVDKYPTVTLCDVAKCCNLCIHKCGYMLPNCLKTNVVQCLQRNMRTSFQFLPGCYRQRESESSQRTLVENSQGTEGPDSTTFHLHKNSSKEDPSAGCSHFLPVNDGKRNKSTTASLDTHAEGDCVSKLDLICSKSHRALNLKDSVRYEGTVDVHSITKKTTDGIYDSTNRCGGEMSLVYGNADTEDQESLTCQRVREYFWKIKDSCARRDMIWPFERRSPTSNPLEAPSDSSIVSIKPLRGHDDVLVKANETNSYSPNNKNKCLHPKAPKMTQEEDNGHSIGMIKESDKMEVASKEVGTSFTLDDISTASIHDGVSEPDGILSSSFQVNGPMGLYSTPSPSALDLGYWESSATHSQSNSSCRSPIPSPVLLLSSQGLGLEASQNIRQESQVSLCCSLSSAPQNSSESPGSFHSIIIFPADDPNSDEEQFEDRNAPKLEPIYCTKPSVHVKGICCTKKSSLLCRTSEEHLEDYFLKFRLPPLLSPVNSPKRIFIRRSFACQSSSSSDEESNEEVKSGQNRLVQSRPVPQRVTDGDRSSQSHDAEPDLEVPQGVLTAFKSPSRVLQSPTSCKGDSYTGDNRQCEEGTASEEDAIRSVGADSDPVNLKTSLPLGGLTDNSSSSSNKDAEEAFSDCGLPHSATDESSDSETAKSNGDGTQAQAAESPQPSNFDEIMAYEHDVLLISVTKDDPELFDNIPNQSLLNLGPLRVSNGPKPAAEVDSRCVSFKANYHLDSPENKEMDDDVDRPWRPQSCYSSIKKEHNKCLTSVNPNHNMMCSDSNNNFLGGIERSRHLQSVSSTYNPPALMSLESSSAGLWTKKSANKVNLRLQKLNAYCRHYFSEKQTCELKMCRFQHLPMNGDEKFCIETVGRFLKNPICLHKAEAVYTGYYRNNAPGAYFSKPWFLALLWTLLKAGMVAEVFSVLSVHLAHKIVPSHDFLLALFCHVRKKGLVSFGLELLQLTLKMVNADLDLSLDCLDCMKTVPTFKQIFPSDSIVSPLSVAGNHKLMSSAAFQEHLSLANSLVEMELSIKQEDWTHMGEIFSSIRWFNHHPNQLEHISGRITIALLADGKDKQAVPFAAFAEAACQKESEDSLIRKFAGRIGVSLLLRYHKTSQWAKGRKVVELLSFYKVSYSTMKSLFGNEDVVSRCSLITVATEFFLQSGSVEAALNILRENNWFLSSCLWPCEPVDLENRTNILMNLLEKTSLRDSLEVLSNLPGIKESNDFVDTSRYCSLFNAHLQMCVERQILPVAADTVAFMICKKLPVKYTLLQVLLHKLGKQNIWLRAREIFRDSLREGYYSGVSAPPGLSTLNVPCWLCEVELALTFEMFITVNARTIMNPSETPTAQLSITLKRTQSDESKYLASGSHLLAAAGILQPKIIIHYTAVNSSQEQTFIVELASAQRWLSHNHSRATELWTR